MTAISKVKQTLATLKGAESTLEMYSLQERDKEINKIKTDLEKRIGVMEFEEPQYKGN